MSSFYDIDELSAVEIGAYIREYGKLDGLIEPCVYIPDIKICGYEYNENEQSQVGLPLGISLNDTRYLPDLILVLINNRSTNALSTLFNDVPIVGVYIGSVIEIEHNANLMIGSSFEKNFPSEVLKRKNIFINKDGILEITSNNSYLGYDDERLISYMTTMIALRFLFLHEVGHHYKGHIAKLSNDNRSFVLLRANDDTNRDFEIEADTFAAQIVAEEFCFILHELMRHEDALKEFCTEEIELLALTITVTAIALPFSIIYKPFFEEKSIECAIPYREFHALMMLAAHLYENNTCRKAAIYDLCDKTNEELEDLIQTIDIEGIRGSQEISYDDFCRYIGFVFCNSKRLYYAVNRLANIDAYLDAYFKTLSYFQEKGTGVT